MVSPPLLESTSEGIYCPRGDFYIDPWKPVREAVISHAHGDHLKSGHNTYHTSSTGEPLVTHRLSETNNYTLYAHDYDDVFDINGVVVSLHPSGHIRGSSQVRVEADGQVWVFSGDYKRQADPTCQGIETQQCDVFITEATFGIPIYQWRSSQDVVREIYDWWQRNAAENRPSMLFGYSLGKTQRMLAELKQFTGDTVYIHGALDVITEIYRDEGVEMLPTELVVDQETNMNYGGKLVMSPPSTSRSPWMRRFREAATAFASGWMQVRGRRRMGGYDKGFVLSDHADWPSLLNTISQSGANEVYSIYGSSSILSRYLREQLGLYAEAWATGFTGEED